MTIPRSLSVVVPAFNEARRIGATLDAIGAFLATQAYAAEIVVVDDGSADDTRGAVRSATAHLALPVRLIRYEQNRGKGFALKIGFREARGEAILFTDADLSTPIVQAEALLATLRDGADVVIGTRKAKGATIRTPQPWYRTRMGQVFTRLVRGLLVDVSDVTCGFKLFRGDLGKEAFARLRVFDWSFDAEILVIAQQLEARIDEVPVVWDDQAGTKVRLLRDALGSAIGLARIVASAAAGRYRTTHPVSIVTEEWTNGVVTLEERAPLTMDRQCV